MLEFHNVSKIYYDNIDSDRRSALKEILWARSKTSRLKPNQLLALSEVSFSVEKGKPLLILGGARSGKTTIAKLASGLSRPSGGSVKIEGRARLVSQKGVVATPFMSLKHHVQLLAMSYGADTKDSRDIYNKIIGMDLFKSFADINVKRMPADVVKRLNYYLGLFIDADIYIFDETFSNDRSDFGLLCRNRFDEIVKTKVVVILAKTSKEVFRSFINQAMILDAGRALFLGTPQEAVVRYDEIRVSGAQHNAQQNELRNRGSVVSNEDGLIEKINLTDKNGDEIRSSVGLERYVTIANSEEFFINVFFSILQSNVGVTVSTQLLTDDILVFANRSLPFTAEKPNTHHARIMIPANLLSGKVYTVNIFVSIYSDSKRSVLKKRKAIEFKITPQVEINESMYPLPGISSGVVSPKLEWELYPVSTSST